MWQDLTIVAAQSIFDVLGGLVADTETLLRSAAVVVAIALVLVTYAKTRAWVPTLGAIVLAGIVLWGINNDDWLLDTTEQTIESTAPRPSESPMVT